MISVTANSEYYVVRHFEMEGTHSDGHLVIKNQRGRFAISQALFDLLRLIAQGYSLTALQKEYAEESAWVVEATDRLVDLGLLWRLAQQQQCCFVVQVGSNDGVSGDPIHRLIVRNRLKAILIEPVPSLFEQLKKKP